jgi:hypothetical protein
MSNKLIHFLIISILLLSPLLCSADAPGDGDPAVDPPPGTIDDLTADDVVKMIINVRNWFAGIVLIIAVFVVLVSAFIYMTAGGNEDKATLARKMFINAIIGIVIASLAYGIVSLITNTLNDLRSGG